MKQRMWAAIVGTALVVTLLVPGVALAGASTDAALGLGAFAVFNQMLAGIGIFGPPRVVVVAPPPPVVVAPSPVLVAPPPPVVVYPYGYSPYYAYAAPVYYAYPRRHHAALAGCPPGLARQGSCGAWRFHRHD